MLEWLLYTLPWQAHVLIVLVVFVGIVVLIGTLFGWKYVRPLILPALAILGAIGLASRNRQQGYNDRVDHEREALDKAEAVVDEKRSDIQGLPDDKLDERIDRWTPR